jgi:hypothetical protein
MVFQSLPTILLILVFYFPSLINATPNSVCAAPGFPLLRPCAGSCLGCDNAAHQLQDGLGCGVDPPNECWCRTDLFTLATSYLSSCVSSSCTVGGWQSDYSSAERFYESYCRGAGFTAVLNTPANTAATTTVDPNAPTVTQVTYVTQTSTYTSSGTSNSGGEWVFFTALVASLIVGIFSLYIGYQVGYQFVYRIWV